MKTEDAQRRRSVPGRHLRRTGCAGRRAAAALQLAAAVHAWTPSRCDEHGRRPARHTTFTTLVPAHRFIGYFTPENRSTVGTGMIVSFDFNQAIKRPRRRGTRHHGHRAAAGGGRRPLVRRRRLDFRPREYWRPGTQVTVDLRLRDVQGAPRRLRHPGQDGRLHRRPRPGQSRSTRTRTPWRCGATASCVATLPITAGAPKHTTYNGKMVVTEMHDVTRMNGTPSASAASTTSPTYRTPCG